MLSPGVNAVMTKPSTYGIIIVGLLLRLLIAPHGGHPHDLQVLTDWANAAQIVGLVDIYAHTSANYPPFGVWLVAGVGWMFRVLTGLPADAVHGIWLLCLKLPAILADCALALLLVRRSSYPTLIAVLIGFNPALILLSAWWGQLESVWALFIVVALLQREHPLLAGVAFGCALMIKQQALVAAPILMLLWLQHFRHGAWKAALGTSLPILIGVLPYMVAGQGVLLWQRMGALVAAPGWLTVNALNLWYLFTWGRGNWQFDQPLILPDTQIILAGVSYRLLGLILLMVWVALMLLLTWRSKDWWLGAALLFAGVFLLPTQVHERYLFGALVMTLGWLVRTLQQADKPHVAWHDLTFFGMITLLHTVNLMWAFPLTALAGSQLIGVLVSIGIIAWTGWALQMLVVVSYRDNHGRPRPTGN